MKMSWFRAFLLLSTLYEIVELSPAGYISSSDPNPVITPFKTLPEATRRKISQIINSKKAYGIVPQFPDSGRQRAVLEQESLVSKGDTAYGRLHEFVGGFTQPRPIVDSPHEKYGNDGGKLRGLSIGLIAGYEAFSNLLNAAIDIPFETVKQLTEKLSTTAGAAGAKISGL